MKDKLIPIVILIIAIIVAIIVGTVMNNNNNSNTNANENNVSSETNTVQELKDIRVSEVTRSVFYAPQYVAIAAGYFEEEGLKIDLTTGQGADNVMTAVLSNQVEIGFAGPEASIYVYNEGKEDYTQVFAQLTKTDGSFLVGSEDIKDFKWTDLKGKTVIPGRKGGVPYMTFEYVLKQNGINPQTDLVLDDSIKFDLMASAFSTGTADFVTLFEPTATQIELAGKGHILASVGEAAGEVPYTAYFAKRSYIDENSDIITKFTNAIYKGQKYVESHTSKEIAELIKDFFPDSDVDILAKAVDSYRSIDAWNKTPYMTEEAFNLLQKIISDAGELEKYAPYDKVVNNFYNK